MRRWPVAWNPWCACAEVGTPGALVVRFRGVSLPASLVIPTRLTLSCAVSSVNTHLTGRSVWSTIAADFSIHKSCASTVRYSNQAPNIHMFAKMVFE
jgi:hypothetical protein